jgi:hypothetical protein
MKLVITWIRVSDFDYGRQEAMVIAGYMAHLSCARLMKRRSPVTWLYSRAED